ncbi:MAG: ArsR family transcriptional regulator [Deltaproteobacteria bacterium]|nr:ArsR family transcriptional regulator [Deltaproteobacteria bacterium]
METIRQQIINLLREEDMTARDLSRALRIREKEVYEHLPHAERSVKNSNKRLTIDPAECLACGYVFKDRRRFTTPGRCPRCKGERIEHPMYRIS